MAASLRKVTGAGVLVCALLAAAGDGHAQIFVGGYTNGLFCAASITCVNPNTSAFQTATLNVVGTGGKTQTLRYVNSTFSGTTTNGGTISFNSPSGSSSTQGVNNFGAFYVGGGNVTYTSPFSLWLNFYSPTTGTLLFAGTVSGTITNGQGGVVIDFDPNQQGLSFSSNGSWATITVTVNDPTVPGEGLTSVSGVISAHVSPEPVTLSLLGTGLIGLAGAARRRRKQNQSRA